VVHDLNNLVAQLSLVVKNAEKHKANPAFMEDAIKTVQHAVNKMDRLLAQLRKGRFEKHRVGQFDLKAIIEKAIQRQSGKKPVPKFNSSVSQAQIEVEEERLCSVLEHLIRNAQEASEEADGWVDIRLRKEGVSAHIEIEDNGCGMDNTFIRERLYKPFQTTKGNAGMGIGVYESKQFIQEAGGRLEVESKVGKGTIFTLILPLVTGN
jgi:putative PEP-CTERM system histidine kinase